MLSEVKAYTSPKHQILEDEGLGLFLKSGSFSKAHYSAWLNLMLCLMLKYRESAIYDDLRIINDAEYDKAYAALVKDLHNQVVTVPETPPDSYKPTKEEMMAVQYLLLGSSMGAKMIMVGVHRHEQSTRDKFLKVMTSWAPLFMAFQKMMEQHEAKLNTPAFLKATDALFDMLIQIQREVLA